MMKNKPLYWGHVHVISPYKPANDGPFDLRETNVENKRTPTYATYMFNVTLSNNAWPGLGQLNVPLPFYTCVS